ncbi:hypothetical protein A2853_01480 [Candidatus Kaiserbacteria bacterium RIFCSPHIGHO2_01_FULL_55_17]|uniref:Uncharacterized protein n=1 Tax=Candidatus Kaiserbacteria bacterium RIFCSPHIGHO2_01_FULL_55_17 TaxID=1798484 RepID=A0A1F6D9P9_9BACT|nr:MAG: hypothetical protein A2853_01480 [Candidatus Kaiserbacteria bacterium RIFCSPHIGHO2_01_FULL_55_17]
MRIVERHHIALLVIASFATFVLAVVGSQSPPARVAYAAPCAPTSSGSNSVTFGNPSPGCTYSIPAYNTLTVTVNGAGGGGQGGAAVFLNSCGGGGSDTTNYAAPGGNGSASTFATVSGGGGSGGGESIYNPGGGSNGDTNVTGGGAVGGDGGGGWTTTLNDEPVFSPDGADGLNGGRASKTYAAGALSGQVTVSVGAGGSGSGGAEGHNCSSMEPWNAGQAGDGTPGQNGSVTITWTNPLASCTFNGSPVAHGASVTAYQASTVPFGSSCVSESRTCNNGTLSGSYQYPSCTVSPPSAPTCTLTPPSQTIDEGESATLNYTISGSATSATINGVSVTPSVSGSYSPSPTVTTNYTMTVSNAGGSNNCGPATVTVNPSPPPPVGYCTVPAGTRTPITGYAWSDTIGWFDLDCSNSGVCGANSFGISIDDTGNLAGCGWSDNIGWVSASPEDLTSCPSGSCTATLSGSNMLQGWMRVLAGGSAQSGGWDGFISLSGSSPDYGPARQADGTFQGFAWGDMNVGWVDFSLARTDVNMCSSADSYSCQGTDTILYTDNACTTSIYATCVEPAFCSEGSSVCLYPPVIFNPQGDSSGHLEIKPSFVRAGNKTKVHWNVSNVESCMVSAPNGDSWVGAAAGCDDETDTCTSGPLGVLTTFINETTIYTLRCTELDGVTPLNESATVRTAPVFQEN